MVDYFIYDVATNAEFTEFVTGYRNRIEISQSITITSLVPNTTYYFRIAYVKDGIKTPYSSAVLTTDAIPTTTTTEATNITSTSFRANFNSVADADSYEVDLLNSSDLVLDTVNSGANYYDFTDLDNLTIYKYRVRVVIEGYESLNSDLRQVTTDSGIVAPDAPTGLTATWANTTAELNFSSSVGADSYKVYIYDGGVPISGYDGKVIVTTSESVTGLDENTTYTWKVKATNIAGDSDFSSEEIFKTKIEVIFYASNKDTRRYIYMTNLAKSFDTRLGTQTSYTEATSSLSPVAISSDGIHVAYTEDYYGSGNAQIAVKNMQTGVITHYDLNNGIQQRSVAFKNGDNNTLYVADLQLTSTQYISSIDLTTGIKTRLINNGTFFGIYGMSFNSDNSEVIYTTGSTGWITAKRSGSTLTSASETVLVNHGTFSYGGSPPQIDKDRNKISYQSRVSGIDQIFDMNFDGTSKTQRTTGSLSKGIFIYSPDSQKILFSEVNGSDRYIQIADTTYNSGTGYFENISTFINTAGNLAEFPVGWGLVQY